MDLGLQDKVALVTGGTHGIGHAIALALATEGCRVAVCGRNEVRLAQTSADLAKRGCKGLTIQGDVVESADLKRILATIQQTWGTVDILVNNVGGGGRWGSETIEATAETLWQEVYDKNVLSAIRLSLDVIPGMRKKQWGRIITITSIYGMEGGCRPWFGMAKAAQVSMMKNMAKNQMLARDGITCNSIAPGSIMIPDTGWAAEQERDPVAFAAMLSANYPLGRLGKPEEVADLVVFIASERAALINGASIVIDGCESNIM